MTEVNILYLFNIAFFVSEGEKASLLLQKNSQGDAKHMKNAKGPSAKNSR